MTSPEEIARLNSERHEQLMRHAEIKLGDQPQVDFDHWFWDAAIMLTNLDPDTMQQGYDYTAAQSVLRAAEDYEHIAVKTFGVKYKLVEEPFSGYPDRIRYVAMKDDSPLPIPPPR